MNLCSGFGLCALGSAKGATGEASEQLSERDIWTLLHGVSDEVAYRLGVGGPQQLHTLTDTHVEMVMNNLLLLVRHHHYSLTHIAAELQLRNLHIWLVPRTPVPGRVARDPLTKETAGLHYAVDVYFGTAVQHAALLRDLGETLDSVAAKMRECAFEVDE